MLSSRESHIGQAQLFGEAFAPRRLQVFAQAITAQIEQRLTLFVMAPRAIGMLAEQTAVPQEGAEHQWVFQALGGVDGDDLHPLGIAFQAQQGVLASALAAALGGKPGQ